MIATCPLVTELAMDMVMELQQINLFTILFIFCVSGVSGIVEAMGLLLGVCRLSSSDGISTCEME